MTSWRFPDWGIHLIILFLEATRTRI